MAVSFLFVFRTHLQQQGPVSCVQGIADALWLDRKVALSLSLFDVL